MMKFPGVVAVMFFALLSGPAMAASSKPAPKIGSGHQLFDVPSPTNGNGFGGFNNPGAPNPLNGNGGGFFFNNGGSTPLNGNLNGPCLPCRN